MVFSISDSLHSSAISAGIFALKEKGILQALKMKWHGRRGAGKRKKCSVRWGMDENVDDKFK